MSEEEVRAVDESCQLGRLWTVSAPKHPMLRMKGNWVGLAMSILVGALLVLAAPFARAESTLRVAVFTTQDDALAPDRIVAGSFDRQFLPAVAGEVLRLPGGGALQHWLRIEFELPPLDARPLGSQYVLLLPRIMVDSIDVHLPAGGGRYQLMQERFFRPAAGDSGLGSSFAFFLPPGLEGGAVVYAAVRSSAAVSIAPELVERQDYLSRDRSAGMLLIAVYTALFVLMANALALYYALREASYLNFVGLTASAVLFLAALNGHVYGVPVLGLLGWWGVLGVYLLAFLCTAFLVGFAQAFMGTRELAPRLDRTLDFGRYALFAGAVVCLLNLQGLVPVIQVSGVLAMVLVVTALVVVGLAHWGAGRRTRLFTLVLALFLPGLWLRVAGSLGWIAPGPTALYAFQAAAAVCAFLLSVGLADRVLEFRRQRDRARQAKEQTDASLRLEKTRAQFTSGLRESLRSSPPGDMVWVTARRLLGAVRLQVPMHSAGITAVGFHGFDLLLSDPGEAKERYARLLAARGSTLRGICRTRTPVQAKFEEAQSGDDPEQAALGGHFVVIPLPVAKPGWGALILERAAWEEFDAEEIKLAQELAELAAKTLEEALGQAELRKRAEIDPLTGTYNRRAFDAMIQQLFERALASRQPIGLLFIDLDHFKQVNDKHGHAGGDQCLRALSEALRAELAPGDILARYGGEEFVVVLPGQSQDQAKQVAERMRTRVSQLRVDSEKGAVKLTVSIGVSGRAAEEEEPKAMIERADKALYAAKRNGRNQVQVAQSYGGGFGAGAGGGEGVGL